MKSEILLALLLLIPGCKILLAAGYRSLLRGLSKTSDDYSSYHMERSRPNGRISGGYTAEEGEFPSFVGLVGATRQFNEWCSGVAISDRLILTAAHCFNSDDDFVVVKAAPSIHHQRLWEDKKVETYIVEKACRSTLYGRAVSLFVVHDYQILRLRTPIEGMNYSLLADKEVEIGDHAVTVGIGSTSDEPPPRSYPDSLRALPVKRVQCQSDEPSHICFKSYMPEYVGDACVGDSGGPVYVRGDKGKLVVVGITSFGDKKCQKGYNAISYNVNVYSCLNDIRDLVKQCSH